MSLYYENCDDECFKTLHNITFCVEENPKKSSASFANEQTIDMIKILIGKRKTVFYQRWPAIKDFDLWSNF